MPRAAPARSWREIPGKNPSRQSEPLKPITEPLNMLLNPILDHLGPVASVPQVRVHPADHLLRAMPESA